LLPREPFHGDWIYTHATQVAWQSLDDTISIELPCKELIEGVGLRWRGNEGKFYDVRGNLIALDPSVDQPGPWALVFARDALLKYLENYGLSIVWVVLGERRVIPPVADHQDARDSDHDACTVVLGSGSLTPP
jgi:hypothetical protein